jgi:TetR/AcrR family transcriptional regulator
MELAERHRRAREARMAQREAQIAQREQQRETRMAQREEQRAALRGRARTRDAEAAREAFLDAGQEEFAQLGFSGARVDVIAKVAGYNKALLFHYFGDKLGLYRAVMSRMKKQIFEQLGGTIERFALASDEAPSREALTSFVMESFRWVFDYYVAHPEMVQTLAWEAAEGWQTFSSCAPINSDLPLPGHVNAYLRRAQQAGVLRPDIDTEVLLATVISLPLNHLISLPRYAVHFPGYDFDSPEALARAREQLLELVLHGTLTIPEEN